MDADLGLQAMQSLVASEPSPSEIGETLRSGRADRFAVVVPWYATGQVDVLLGCPTGRTDVVRELVDGTWSDVDDPRPWSFVADVMHELQP